VQAGGQGWSSSIGSDAVTASTSTAAVASIPQQSCVQLYSDVRVAGVSPASSLSAVDLPTNTVYRSSVVYQQVRTAIISCCQVSLQCFVAVAWATGTASNV